MTDEYGMGWTPAPFDARDWLPQTLKAMVGLGLVHPMVWTTPAHHYHQGQTPHCCGFSALTFWASAGSTAGMTADLPNDLGHELYYQMKVLDGEPGQENGSNLRSVGRVLVARGVADAYSLTRDFAEVKEWCEHYGVVILGIPWTQGMFEKDQNSVIHPTGATAGGHAICDYAVEQPFDNGLFNTWGDDWGSAWIADTDLEQQLRDGGEALLTVKKGPPPKPPILPWELEQLVASGELVVSAEDRVSILAAAGKAMNGFKEDKDHPTITFRPFLDVTEHQVRTVLHNLDRDGPEETNGEWERAATRAWVRDNFSGLHWLEERWLEPLSRYQLLLLTGRMLRGL